MTDTNTKTLYRRVLARALPTFGAGFKGLSFGVLADFCVVGLLILSMWLIVRAAEQPPILYLNAVIVSVRAFAIGRAAFRYVERIYSHDAALKQLGILRGKTLQAIFPKIPGGIESERRGEVLAAFVDDTDQLQDEHLRVRQPLTVSAIVVLLSVLLISLVSPLAAGILLLALLLAGGVAVLVSFFLSAASDRELSRARALLTDTLLERFASGEVLRAFGAMPAQRERIRAAEQNLATVALKRAGANGLAAAILSLGAGAATLVTLVALQQQLGFGLNAPFFAALVIAPTAVFEVFAQVTAAFQAARSVRASAQRVALLTEGELPGELPVEPLKPECLPVSTGGKLLELRSFTVTHPGARAPAVRDVNLVLRSGSTLLVTGDSGAGKSTLAQALVRFIDYEGSYLLHGVEAKRLSFADVRKQIVLCEQNPHLFDTDIRQNLLFAKPDASDAQLLAVLERVGLKEWVFARGGLDARVGEHGALVSGGQAGRLTLARALLADAPIVILDEPTAGVDHELADVLLKDLLGAVPEDRAVLLISHTKLPEGISCEHLVLP